MSEPQVRRKDLWGSLGSVSFKDWQKAAGKLGLPITSPSSGTSHQCIRKPTDPIDYTIKGFIANIYPGMSRQVNGKVFKVLLDYGINEDDLWRALGRL